MPGLKRERFGRFILLERMAAGGTAEIFLAYDPTVDGRRRFSVIKRLRPDRQGDRLYLESLIDEARLLKRLSHPNIVRMRETGSIDDVHYLVLDHVWGESLSALCSLCAEHSEHFFPARTALHVGAEVASALHHAHTLTDEYGSPAPIFHRDVTLGNVMVTYDGKVQVLDFGIAMASDRLVKTEVGEVKGTPIYLAPEQVLGEAATCRSDIYQLGVLLYKLLVGSEPLNAKTIAEVLDAIVRGQIIDPASRVPGFPRDIKDVLMRAMALDPLDRYKSARAFAGELRELAGESSKKGRETLGLLMETVAGHRRDEQIDYVRAVMRAVHSEQETELTATFLWSHPEPKEVVTEYLCPQELASDPVPAVIPRPVAFDDDEDLPEELTRSGPSPFSTAGARPISASSSSVRTESDVLAVVAREGPPPLPKKVSLDGESYGGVFRPPAADGEKTDPLAAIPEGTTPPTHVPYPALAELVTPTTVRVDVGVDDAPTIVEPRPRFLDGVEVGEQQTESAPRPVIIHDEVTIPLERTSAVPPIEAADLFAEPDTVVPLEDSEEFDDPDTVVGTSLPTAAANKTPTDSEES